jgi:hypothetical protein
MKKTIEKLIFWNTLLTVALVIFFSFFFAFYTNVNESLSKSWKLLDDERREDLQESRSTQNQLDALSDHLNLSIKYKHGGWTVHETEELGK